MKRKRECICSAELDMETLVWTRGRAFPLAWLQERLRCPQCGSRRVTLASAAPAAAAVEGQVEHGLLPDLR